MSDQTRPCDPTPPARHDAPGDLGRRVRARRDELGLSREEVAARARIAPGYLAQVESRPVAVETVSLTRLADALETTVSSLLGGSLNEPPGQALPAARPALARLDAAECWDRMAERGVGRVAVVTGGVPRVIPVDYRVVAAAVVFRTGEDPVLESALGQAVGFEVDRIDDALGQGWSVLATGPAEPVTDPAAIGCLAEQADPQPWAGGDRGTWVRIVPTEITGREIRPR